MQADEVKGELDRMRERLARHEAERGSIIAVIRAYEDWLRVLTQPNIAGVVGPAIDTSSAVALTSDTLSASRTQPVTRMSSYDVPRRATKGDVSIAEAGLKVLEAAGGTSLHVREIQTRIEQLGARTDAKNPGNVINAILRRTADKGYPIKAIGSRQWRWTGADQVRTGETEHPFSKSEHSQNGMNPSTRPISTDGETNAE